METNEVKGKKDAYKRWIPTSETHPRFDTDTLIKDKHKKARGYWYDFFPNRRNTAWEDDFANFTPNGIMVVEGGHRVPQQTWLDRLLPQDRVLDPEDAQIERVLEIAAYLTYVEVRLTGCRLGDVDEYRFSSEQIEKIATAAHTAAPLASFLLDELALNDAGLHSLYVNP